MIGTKTMKTIVLLSAVATVLLLASGCATKKYVKQQIDPLTGKVTELSELARKNSNDIKDVDSRAQQGIQTATSKADAADDKAMTADKKAETAQSMATDLKGQLTGVEGKLGNIDNYKQTETVTLNFPFNQYKLKEKETASLDELASKIKDRNAYIVQIEGYTDSVGNKDYNYDLSQKRAETVVRYLAEKYDIPLYRLFIVGLGASKPIDDNKSRAGRAENRRVEVHLLENPEIMSAKK
ncbi:MAG: OmpA family protein [Acidobacteriia bacterium]|nr:OmpA family protein [Terriglobia bacterium]